ncbi:toll-like receptor 8 [Ambystoma mexicanum]|uniref:toll-like receptor 8 n=1 Tax=Ambystoma mexicanum TaxID=8296 RepID=UPI0037E9B556
MFSTKYNFLFLHLLIYDASQSLAGGQNWKTLPCDKATIGSSLHFDCSARRLTTIPEAVEYNSSSAELNLSENLIRDISEQSFQGWHSLTKLNLNWNHQHKEHYENVCDRGMNISNGTFRNLLNLIEISADGLTLCNIPTGIPVSLRRLSLQYNHIFSITKESLSELRHLNIFYLGHNCYFGNACGEQFSVDDDAFDEISNLTILSLSFNNLTRVPINLPATLRELYLSNNQIKHVNKSAFENLRNLEILHLSGNCPRCYNSPYPCQPCPGKVALQIHPQAFTNLENLMELNLGSTSLTCILASWFEGTPKLKKLNLALNYLVQEIATGEFLVKLPNLQVLDLSFNYARKAYPKYLNISDNFSKLSSLRELHIRGYVFEGVVSEYLHPLKHLPNLNILNLAVNFIKRIDLTVFQEFSNLTLIYLSENRISPLSKSKVNKSCENTIQSHRIKGRSILNHVEKTVNDGMWHSTSVTGDGAHTHYPALIKPKCSSYGKTLDLSLNSIFYIDPEQFLGFEDIACLNLSSNAIGQYLNGTEFIYLTNLTYLDLSYNRLDLGTNSAFSELNKLEVLDLSYNAHYFIVEGVVHELGFLEHLPSLKVLNLSWNQIFTLTQTQINSSSLEQLIFKGNRLNKLWQAGDKRYFDCFSSLSNLSYLDLSHNMLKRIPNETFSNLPRTLTELYLNNNELDFFSWTSLQHFPLLKKLDLSSNSISMLATNFHIKTNSLQTLLLKHNTIAYLPNGFVDKAYSLTHLDLSNNLLQVINQSTFSNQSALKILVLKGNPFDCTCETIGFLWWMQITNLSIPRLATDVTCSTPVKKKGDSVVLFDLRTCNLENMALALFLLSFLVIGSTTVMLVLKHLFYWDAWYVYFFCLAKLKGNSSLAVSKCLYDAYISYDTKDAAATEWVMKELAVHLEGKESKQVLLCLEERDWEPGKAVIDNLAQSIHQSRKTIFVLTERYVKSGIFKTAFYIALQRLMDESVDVIVLILLQPVLQHSQYLRLRKKICKSSILEWPKNPNAESFFWQKLKNVVLTENYRRYNRFLTNLIIPQYKPESSFLERWNDYASF